MAPSLNYTNRQGTTGNTAACLSTRFKIFAPIANQGPYQKVGVISSFEMSESKRVEAIRGLGFGDVIAEIVPGVTEPMEIQVRRAAMYLSPLMAQFGYKAGALGAVRSLRHHKWPFDIKTEIVFSELASLAPQPGTPVAANVAAEGGLNNYGNNIPLYCVATLIVGCWMSNFSTAYGIEETVVQENCSITATDAYDVSGSVYGDFLNSGNSPDPNVGDVTGGSVLFS